MKKKYYAVAKGRKNGIFTSWDECKKQVDGFSGAVFKSFDSESEAKRYISSNRFISAGTTRICILCSKPSAKKGELCGSCTRKKRELKNFVTRYYHGRTQNISNTFLLSAKSYYKVDDIFKFLTEYPEKIWAILYKSKAEKRLLKSDYKKHIRETPKYSGEDPIPSFVTEMLGPAKSAIRVSGDRRNPTIIYYCKKCGETLYTRYSDYKFSSGHDCSGIKSSGEVIVGDFLKKHGIKYKTQRDTLKCINPDTGFIMPYDFEIVGRRVLVEVQGDQHREFIPRFHVTKEAFEYQQKKDRYKREYAESKGYKLIEVWYEDLSDAKLSALLLDIKECQL